MLRGLARDGAPGEDAEALCPGWLLARWKSAWGQEAALNIAALIDREPDTDLSFKAAPGKSLTDALGAHELPGGTWRTALGGALTEWPGFDEGAWWVQDASAAIPADTSAC